MTEINRYLFKNFLTKDINLDWYVITESMEIIHRWNFLDLSRQSEHLDSAQLCKNIEETFKNYGPLSQEEFNQATKNLDAMRKKFGKYIPNGFSLDPKIAKASGSVETIHRIKERILPTENKSFKKRYFTPMSYHYVTPSPQSAQTLSPQKTSPAQWRAKPEMNPTQRKQKANTPASTPKELDKTPSKTNKASDLQQQGLADQAAKKGRSIRRHRTQTSK